ncbi:putative amidase AmiC [Nocardia camponoti]|uniref:amidase n=1 Tax=Nocardia camponoti TaxID=1616106 RepID=A0A917VDH0_9NOCA|nr:putative amidase AmiC [Nocardia camponoti]
MHSFTDDALGTLDATGVADALRAGEVSRREVIDAAIARTRAVDPTLNAVQIEAFAQAQTAPETVGVFAGVPAFIKDNVDVKGLPTAHGSVAFAPKPAKLTGEPAAQFLHSGVIALGKSRLPEFGLTASTEFADAPPTRNPWNPNYSTGASSGGSAALVAAGAVPIAHANDGGGSIRIPAAATGLVGLKTTRERMLDQPGARNLPVNLLAEGVVTRSVRDTANYVAAVEGFGKPSKWAPIGLVAGPSDTLRRIGVVRADILGRPVHPDNGAILDSAAKTLARLGHELVEVSLDLNPRFVDDFKRYWAGMALAQSLSMRIVERGSFDAERLDPFTRGLIQVAVRNPLASVASAWRLRSGTTIYDEQFDGIDVMLTPVLSHPSPLIGELDPNQPFDELFTKLVDYVGFTPLNNIGGGPGIAVPHGLLPIGLPGSVQLAAPRGDEATLLDLAYQLESESPFPRIFD